MSEITINIIEQTADGEKPLTFLGPSTLIIDSDKSILTLKRNIRDAFGIPVDEQALYYTDIRLPDRAEVSIIGNHGTVFLCRPSIIQIYAVWKEMRRPLFVAKSDTILRVKKRIVTSGDPAEYAIRISVDWANTTELQDDSTIQEVGIKESDILHLRKKRVDILAGITKILFCM